jgi:hypothetical protein
MVAGMPGSSSSSSHTPLPLLRSHHHGLVSSLEAAHAAYGPTVRLAKRWLGVQLMLGDQVGGQQRRLGAQGLLAAHASPTPRGARRPS